MSRSDYILGYGSLLSAYSRQTYSNMHGEAVPVTAKGWVRGWTATYPDENATYLGVRSDPASSMRAALMPTVIDPALRHRERGYDFIELEQSSLTSDQPDVSLPDGRYWIVVNRDPAPAPADCPLPQTYVDTCLIGCLEMGGEDLARHFIENTEHWTTAWLNDRDHAEKRYPRHSPLDVSTRDLIDQLLDNAGHLHMRQG